MRIITRVAFGLAIATLIARPSFGQTVADFYAGHEIKVIVPAGAGGGYGFDAQLLSKTLGKYVPGNPTVVPQYMPGAGGTKAANYLYNVAPQDGSVIGMVLRDIAESKVLHPDRRYDPTKFNWLGRLSPLRSVLMIWHGAPATTIEGLKKHQVVLASVGKTSSTYTNPALMNALIGTKFKIVTGYRGAADAILAMERGEAHGWAASWEVVKHRKPNWVAEKKILPVVHFSLSPNPDIRDVPLLGDLITDPDKKRMAEFMLISSELGRILLAPPNVPADRVAALRAAIGRALEDPELLAAAEKGGHTIEPAPHQEIERLIERTMSTPPALVEKVRMAVSGK